MSELKVAVMTGTGQYMTAAGCMNPGVRQTGFIEFGWTLVNSLKWSTQWSTRAMSHRHALYDSRRVTDRHWLCTARKLHMQR